MDSDELAKLLEELETRVERLRALYEQYFMGLERIEPLTLRKEIDRRLWVLRREQIRNTGTRFKLQTVVQRYNTYQQYWQRIVREIESGTYQRDLGRAAQRFGEAATTALGRRRQKMFEKGEARRTERDAQRRASTPPGGASASGGPPTASAMTSGSRAGEALSELYEELAIDDSDMFVDAQSPIENVVRSSRPAPRVPPRPVAGAAPAVVLPSAATRGPRAGDSEASVGAATGPRPPPTGPRPPPAVPRLPSLPVSRTVLSAPAGAQRAPEPALARPSPLTGALPRTNAAAPPPRPSQTAIQGSLPPRGAPGGPNAPPSRSGVIAPQLPSLTAVEGPVPPPSVATARGLTPPTASLTSVTPGAPPAATRAPLAPGAAPPPVTPPRATPAAVVAARAANAAAAARATNPAAAAPAINPAAAARAINPAAAAPATNPAAAARPPSLSQADDPGLSQVRLRQLYGAYVDAKRQANESTASITYDKVAANLRDTAKQLRDKHHGREVDFEVVLKNGKPVLKPVLKS